MRSPPQPLGTSSSSSEQGWDPSDRGGEDYEECPESTPTRIANASRHDDDLRPFSRFDAQEDSPTHSSSAEGLERPFCEVQEDARTLYAKAPRTDVDDHAPTNAVRPAFARPRDEDFDNSRASTRPPQPSFAALGVLPMVSEDQATRIEASPSSSFPHILPRASSPVLEWPDDDGPDALFENPTTPLPKLKKKSRPVRRSRAACVSMHGGASPYAATTELDEAPRSKLDLTMRSRDRSVAARPVEYGPQAHLRTEPIGHPIMPDAPMMHDGAFNDTMRAPAMTPSTPMPMPMAAMRPTYGSIAPPAPSAPPASPVPSYRRYTPPAPTGRGHQAAPPAPEPSSRVGQAWARGPAPSEPWNESPWVVSPAGSSQSVRPAEPPFKVELPMIMAIATGAVAFCLMVGAFLYLRSDGRPNFEDARSAAFAPDTMDGSLGPSTAVDANPSLTGASATGRAVAPPAPAISVAAAPADSTHRPKRAKPDGTRSDGKAETSKSDSADSSRSSTGAPSTASSAKPSKRGQAAEKGKSIEQILDELGEEQLRR